MTNSLSLTAQVEKLLVAGSDEEAVRVAVVAAQAGDPEALHMLALWHVYGDPVGRNFATARTLFRRAGEAGHPGAALTYAVFVAIGAGGHASWLDALALLDRAAQKDPVAARQCELIDAMKLDRNGAPAARPPVELLSTSPKVAVARALFTPGECAHIAELAAPSLSPSVVVDSVTGCQAPHPIRTSEGTVLGPIQQDLVVHALDRRIAVVSGTHVEQGEPLSVLRYAPGQQYRLHHDCLPGETNQRIMTAIIYLNADYGGGATRFPAIDLDFRGETGDAILFANTLEEGGVDERSRHAGLPVTRGEKWICTRWIRGRDFDPWGMRAA